MSLFFLSDINVFYVRNNLCEGVVLEGVEVLEFFRDGLGVLEFYRSRFVVF